MNTQKILSYPKSKMKVLLLESISDIAVDKFKKEGYKVEVLNSALTENELIEKIVDVSVLCIRSKTEVTNNVIKSAKKLLAIGAYCIGTNQIDLQAASMKGIAVFNAPYSNTRSVVEMIIGEIIVLSRKLFDQNANLHSGLWDKSAKGSHEIRGKTLGIIGYGNIGTQLSVVAEALGMKVLFYDILDKLALGNAKKCGSLKELFREADIITIHVDGNKNNKNLIGKKEFELMKKGAIFINASRGHVVDIDSLVMANKSGKLAGAAIDVFPDEPKNNNEKFISSLQKLSNVILTPHIGGSTEEAQKNIGGFVGVKLTQFIDTGNTVMSVNFPNLQLPDYPNSHRVIHVHRNEAGVLSKLNTIFADHSVNIEGQYLKTNEDIGYVISDVNKNHNQKVIEELREVPGTIKVRVLY